MKGMMPITYSHVVQENVCVCVLHVVAMTEKE